MIKEIVVRPEADITESVLWYNDCLSGLGSDFLSCIDEAFRSIQRNPDFHKHVYKNVRRALIRRFPYVVFYIVEETQIVV